MKKLILCYILSAVCFGARADDITVPALESRAAEIMNQNIVRNAKPPKPWWHGWQVGVGVPLTLTGYNGFIGYMNKKSNSWWGRRIGARFDFQIPSELAAEGRLREKDGKYELDVSGDILFYKPKFDNIVKIDKVSMDLDGESYLLDLDGANAKVALKNQNVGGLIDIYPFGNTWFLGGIRLSGGYYAGRMDLEIMSELGPNDLFINEATQNPGYVYMIPNSSNGDRVIANVESRSKIGANFKWKYRGPYLGLGFDLGVIRGFKFYMDAGVVFAKPPRISQDDISMPTLFACYEINGGDCDKIKFDMNTKPDAGALTSEILAQVIEQNVKNAAASPEFVSIRNAIELEHGEVDYKTISRDIIDFLNGTGTSAWIGTLATAGGDTDDVWLAFEEVQLEWANISDPDTAGSLQKAIDDAWNDYTKGIDDLNDSLKDMRFMPIIKLGVMYRF